MLTPRSSFRQRADPKMVLKALTEHVNNKDLSRRKMDQILLKFCSKDEFNKFKV